MAERTGPPILLLWVELRHNHVKMRDAWFWEVVDEHCRALHEQCGHGVFAFGWARSERSAYRQAFRRKRRFDRAALDG